jgi:hypothetical protein
VIFWEKLLCHLVLFLLATYRSFTATQATIMLVDKTEINQKEGTALKETLVVTGVVTTMSRTLTTETDLRNYPGLMEHSYQTTDLIVLTVIIQAATGQMSI